MSVSAAPGSHGAVRGSAYGTPEHHSQRLADRGCQDRHGASEEPRQLADEVTRLHITSPVRASKAYTRPSPLPTKTRSPSHTGRARLGPSREARHWIAPSSATHTSSVSATTLMA